MVGAALTSLATLAYADADADRFKATFADLDPKIQGGSGHLLRVATLLQKHLATRGNTAVEFWTLPAAASRPAAGGKQSSSKVVFISRAAQGRNPLALVPRLIEARMSGADFDAGCDRSPNIDCVLTTIRALDEGPLARVQAMGLMADLAAAEMAKRSTLLLPAQRNSALEGDALYVLWRYRPREKGAFLLTRLDGTLVRKLATIGYSFRSELADAGVALPWSARFACDEQSLREGPPAGPEAAGPFWISDGRPVFVGDGAPRSFSLQVSLVSGRATWRAAAEEHVRFTEWPSLLEKERTLGALAACVGERFDDVSRGLDVDVILFFFDALYLFGVWNGN